jgi:hypothetical protein
MTIGIYKLIFSGLEDWPYVGQSSNIEQRFHGHCSDLKHGKSNFKMQEAYAMSGLPSHYIVEECSIEQLNSREIFWIKRLNSVDNGLNLTDKCVNNGFGEENFRSKYSNSVIENVFFTIVNNPDKNLKEIATIVGLEHSILASISSGYNHTWLKEKYPSEYEVMLKQSRRGLNTAKYQGIEYPAIKSPDGHVYNITNLQKFCRDHDLQPSCIHGVLHGNRKSHKKWKLAA